MSKRSMPWRPVTAEQSLQTSRGRDVQVSNLVATLAAYEPDSCSGVFRIGISSSKDPQRVEKGVFEVIDRMKSDIDVKELARLRDRVEPKRREEASDNQAIVDRMVERTLDGISIDELALEAVTREEMLAAARKYMPSHRKSYVRLALAGQ